MTDFSVRDARAWAHCPHCASAFASADDPGEPLALQRCSGCGFVRYDNPVPVVAALVELPEGVVLVHARHWPAGTLGLVTGFLEQGEHPEAATLREVREELGLEARIDHLIGHYPIGPLGQIAVAYALTAEGSIERGAELDDVRVIPRDRLRPWAFGTGPAVHDWLALRRSDAHHRQPIMDALELLGRRWALRVLWELRVGPLGFRQLQSACGISPDTLSARLKDLSAAGLVSNDGQGRTWRVTDRALALSPHLIGLARWAADRRDEE